MHKFWIYGLGLKGTLIIFLLHGTNIFIYMNVKYLTLTCLPSMCLLWTIKGKLTKQWTDLQSSKPSTRNFILVHSCTELSAIPYKCPLTFFLNILKASELLIYMPIITHSIYFVMQFCIVCAIDMGEKTLIVIDFMEKSVFCVLFCFYLDQMQCHWCYAC